MRTIKKQFLFALGLFLIYYSVSTIVYYIYGDPGTGIADAVYMTGISFTTVGYGDTGFGSTPTQKAIFTPLFLWGFLIQIVFVASAVNAFIALKIHIRIEESFMKFTTRFKKGHIVIFGVGKIAPHIIDELIDTRASFIVIDNSQKQIDGLREKYSKLDILHMQGKTITDQVLKDANIAAAGVAIFDLGSDELNHIAGDLVQRANNSIKIIAVNDQLEFLTIMEGEGKMAVNRHHLCAMRIASLAVRPSVATYLDKMLHIQDGVHRIEEIFIEEKSTIIGKTLKEVFDTTQLKLLVIGIEDLDTFDIIPRGKQVIEKGITLFVQGEVSQIEIFRKLAGGKLSFSDLPSQS